jgi:hypothetical protein
MSCVLFIHCISLNQFRYLDYAELVDRTGNKPPLHHVEANLQEIRDRVHTIECEYATKIQKIYRGLLGRRFIILYRFAVSKWIQLRLNAALVMQRIYRGWRDSQKSKSRREKRVYLNHQRKYIQEQQSKLQTEKLVAADQRAITNYKKGWKSGQMALLKGYIAYGEGDGKKHLAFRDSNYYEKGTNTTVEAIMTSNIELKASVKAEAASKEVEAETRAEFVHKRRQRHPLTAKYFEAEHVQRRKAFKSRVMSDGDKVCLFSRPQNLRKERAPGVKLLKQYELPSDDDIIASTKKLHSFKTKSSKT